MALTLIRLKEKNGPYRNLTFKTLGIYEEQNNSGDMVEKFYVIISVVDDELKPLENQNNIKVQIEEAEDDYHIGLRLQASLENQLITSHSTNPEWNPSGYTKNLEDVI